MSEIDPQANQDVIKKAHELRAGYNTYHKLGSNALNWLESEHRFNKADSRAEEAGKLVNEHQHVIEASARSEMETDLSQRKVV